MSTRFKFKTTQIVRFSDTDAMGHANNSHFFNYLEEGRVAYFKTLYANYDLKKVTEVFPFILADIQCSFKAPLYAADKIDVWLGVTEIKNSSFVIEYDIIETAKNTLAATARSVQVCFDYQKGKSMPIPQDLLNRFKKP